MTDYNKMMDIIIKNDDMSAFKWTTRDGRTICVDMMDDVHLFYSYKMLMRQLSTLDTSRQKAFLDIQERKPTLTQMFKFLIFIVNEDRKDKAYRKALVEQIATRSAIAEKFLREQTIEEYDEYCEEIEIEDQIERRKKLLREQASQLKTLNYSTCNL